MTETVDSTQFLVNKLPTQILLKAGYLTLPKGGYVSIKESDLTETTIAWAVDNNWVTVTDVKPNLTPEPDAEISITDLTNPFQGLTEDELKADIAKSTAEVEKATADVALETKAAAKAEKKAKAAATATTESI